LEKFLQIVLTYFISALAINSAKAQLTITGNVYDSTKVVPVKDVIIKSTSGVIVMTDSNGHYEITAKNSDSLVFIYNYKPTLKFAVSDIAAANNFDIALHIRVAEKFKTLKEVRVYAKTYKQDSIENRERYAKIFEYDRPGLSLSSNAWSGAAGLDLNELVNIFRFKHNRQLQRMQERLMEEEKEKFISYRFSKTTVRRVTGLQGKELELFMKEYRPDFEFTQMSSLVDFYQYILNASYKFKEERGISNNKEGNIEYRTKNIE
jgi:hypothetical protein